MLLIPWIISHTLYLIFFSHSFFDLFFFVFFLFWGELNIIIYIGSGIWHLAMVGQSRKWMIIIATTWIQAFTGTNFDFSTYSSTLKSVLGISQVQLNYLSVASDMGKALGWCCGVCLMHFPSWIVMFIATFMGLFGYGLQWLVIQKLIVLPYFMVSLPFNLSFFFSVSLVFSLIIVKWVCLFPFFLFFFFCLMKE